MLINPSPLVHQTIGCAIAVHRQLGPGLLESAYGSCLYQEFTKKGLHAAREVPIPVKYGADIVDCAYRADFVVESTLLIEIKSIERFDSVHHAQILTYLRLLDLHEGLLINFNRLRLVDGLRRALR